MISASIVPVVREFFERWCCSNISLDVMPRVKSVSFSTVYFFNVVIISQIVAQLTKNGLQRMWNEKIVV